MVTSNYLLLLGASQEEIDLVNKRWKAVYDAESLPPPSEENNGNKTSLKDMLTFGVMFEIIACE